MLSVTHEGKICRLCLTEKGGFIPIFRSNLSECSTSYLLEKIAVCTEVKIQEEDGLPKFICHHCLYQIEIWFSFKQLCLRTDSFLHKASQKKTSLAFDIADKSSESHLNTNDDSQSLQDRTDESMQGRQNNDHNEHCSISSEVSLHSDCHQSVTVPTRVYSRLKRICCKLCDAKFTTREDLEAHKSTTHNTNITKAAHASNISEDQAHAEMDQNVCDKNLAEMDQSVCDVETLSDRQGILHENPKELLKTPIDEEVVETATIILNAAPLNRSTDKSLKGNGPKTVSHLGLKYRKANLYPCPFCGTFIQRISRHIETQHSNEADVKKLMNLEKKSVERHRLLEELRIKGILKYDKRIKATHKKTFNQNIQPLLHST